MKNKLYFYEAIMQEEEWFKNLWDNDANWPEFYELAERIDEILKEKGEAGIFGGKLRESKFEEGWQYRDVLGSEDYEYCRDNEWYSLLFGWW